MDFPLAPERPSSSPFPWRTAAVLAAGVAAVELVLLVVVGGALLAKPDATPHRRAGGAARAGEKAAVAKPDGKHVVAPAPQARAATADLPRRKVRVLVLNGNGRTGAAAAAASSVGGRGYRISAVANAPRQDYPQSIVLFRRGFEGEGVRLAKDLAVKVVGPLDGMRTAQLHGAHVVYILGG